MPERAESREAPLRTQDRVPCHRGVTALRVVLRLPEVRQNRIPKIGFQTAGPLLQFTKPRKNVGPGILGLLDSIQDHDKPRELRPKRVTHDPRSSFRPCSASRAS